MQVPMLPFESFPTEARGQNFLFQGARCMALTPGTPERVSALWCLFREGLETGDLLHTLSFQTPQHHMAFPELGRLTSLVPCLRSLAHACVLAMGALQASWVEKAWVTGSVSWWVGR